MLVQYCQVLVAVFFVFVFGIYEKLVDSILNFFKDIKKNLIFLFPILLGVSIGVIIFSKLLLFLFQTYPNQTKSMFIGLILGCLPILFKQANQVKGFRLHYLLYLTFTLLLGLLSIFIENFFSNHIVSNTNIVYLVLSGFFMSIGIVVPRSK